MAAVTVASSLYVPILIGNAIDYIIGPQNVEFKAITAILSEVGIVIAITALSQWKMCIRDRCKTDIFTDGHVREQIKVLEYHTNLFADLVDVDRLIGQIRAVE